MIRLPALAALLLLLASWAPAAAEDGAPLSRIAFGSCARQNEPQPIWEAVVAKKPDVFLFIGDNIYGDSEDLDVLRAKWEMLGKQPGYRKLKQTCPVLATWDDHDYGANDAGVEYPKKRESQQLFLDFFEEPADSPRRRREGVYDAQVFGPEGKRVQVILLDTRYFRSPLVRRQGATNEDPEGYAGPYGPSNDPHATMLGAAQWKWLEEQLRVPAELRVVASSIQVIPNEHGWEKWGNFPRERERLFKLIGSTGAAGVVFISGDRHSAEISGFDPGVGYTLYDVTSSSLNAPSRWHNEINPHRLGTKYTDTNFGMIAVDWQQADPTVKLQVCSEQGKVVLQKTLQLSELQPRRRHSVRPTSR